MILADAIDFFQKFAWPIGMAFGVLLILLVPAFRRSVVEAWRKGQRWGQGLGAGASHPGQAPSWLDSGKRKVNSEQWIYMAVCGAVLFVGILLVVFMAGRGSGTGKTPAGPEAKSAETTNTPMTDADYAYLVMCPKLVEEFGLDHGQVLQLAILGLHVKSESIDTIGAYARQVLSRTQGELLEDMLRDGRLMHVQSQGSGLVFVKFTPVGWDQSQAKTQGLKPGTLDFGGAISNFYSASYVNSLIRGIDDVLPLLDKGGFSQRFAADWLNGDGKPTDDNRASFCRALLSKFNSSSESTRFFIAQTLLQRAQKPEAPILADLYSRPQAEKLMEPILDRIVASDPTLLEGMAAASADDPNRLTAAITRIVRLPEDQAQPMIVQLTKNRDERVRTAARKLGERLLASATSRPSTTGPSRPGGQARNPIDNPADAIESLKGTDTFRRREAARWLAAAKTVDDPKAVLAALDKLLDSKDAFERREMLAAYIHWAGAEQAPRLTALANSGADLGLSWPTLMAGLMRLDPATGRKLLEDRHGDFAFRSPTVVEMKRLDSTCESSFWPLLDSTKPEVVRTTCDILSEIGTKSSLPLLEALVAKASKPDQPNIKRMVDNASAKIKGRGK